jgi:RND family efflux transporter MFP subunit
VDQQLQQARADLQTAQANLRQAEITADRWEALWKTDSVSKQETDQAVNALHAMKATVDSNMSNVRRLEELQGFQKIYAPFDGVITARNTDIGALINSGASTPQQELFHLAAINTLRVFVAVPQFYSQAVRPGATASLTLDEFPGKSFTGTIARNSNSIDPASRTLLVEVDVDNRNGTLLPGAYVRVHLKLPQSVNSVTVPANTLLFRSEGLRVGVVRNGRAELVPVTIGVDYGSSVEVVSGLQPTDAVILNPSDSLISGTTVQVNAPPAQAAAR